MDFSKYIITKNINLFKLSMTDVKKYRVHKDIAHDLDAVISMVQASLNPRSYEFYTVSKSGHKRSILSRSVKWAKVEGLKNVGVTGLYLAPSTHIQGLNTCPFAGTCQEGCIAFTGHLGMFHRATIENRTLALYHYTERYLIDMLRQLYMAAFKASIDDKQLYIRLNGTSDLPFYKVLNMDAIVSDFNGLAGFYDYTKFPIVKNPWSSYHLTYSYSETTKKIHPSFDRVAIVVSRVDKLCLLNDYPNIFGDGDLHDVRPLDQHRVILLQAKNVTASDKKMNDEFIQSYETCLSLFVGEEVRYE